MLSVLKNDWEYVKTHLKDITIVVVITIAALVMSIFMGTKMTPRFNIAVVGKDQIEENHLLRVTYLREKPAKSMMVKGQYDAVLIYDSDGKLKIDTIKGNDFLKKLNAALGCDETLVRKLSHTRKIGTTIMGYLMMFLMMQGLFYLRLFGEDREKHRIERITTSPIHFHQYFIGHMIFTFLMVVVPALAAIVFVKFAGYAIGFKLWQYAFFFAITILFGSSLAVFVYSISKDSDSGNMLGMSYLVLTTILAGGFYSMNDKGVLGKVLYLIPQKSLLKFIGDVENHKCGMSGYISLIYVIIISIVLVAAGVWKTRRKYTV